MLRYCACVYTLSAITIPSCDPFGSSCRTIYETAVLPMKLIPTPCIAYEYNDAAQAYYGMWRRSPNIVKLDERVARRPKRANDIFAPRPGWSSNTMARYCAVNETAGDQSTAG